MRFPKGPEIKLPKLRLRRSSAKDAGSDEGRANESAQSEAGRKRLQPPPLVQDVYRDLRDRRLLLPAAGLLLALVVVPVFLRAKPAPVSPASPPPVSADAAAAVPAVLAEQEVGIRDYRKRLGELKAKNPFKAKFQYTPQEVAEQTALRRPLREPGSGGSADTGASVPVTPPAAGTGSGQAPVRPPSAEPTPKPGHPDVRAGLVEPVAKVLVGRVGEKKRKQEYRVTDPIPGKKRTVVTLVGFGDSFSTALFLVSRQVSATRGEGRCRPSGRECDLVLLKPGQARFFDLERPNGSVHRYRVKLISLRGEVTERRTFEGG
jgi:hypothetical protein